MKLFNPFSSLPTAQSVAISLVVCSLLTQGAVADKPAVILVPGAFHSATVYNKVINQLGKFGYDRTFPIPLPSVGQLVDRQADIDAVREILLQQINSGQDVILVGNSYGGAVIGEAVKGLQGNGPTFQPPETILSRLRRFITRGNSNIKTQDPTPPGKVLGLVFIAGYLPWISDVEHPETHKDIKTISPSCFNYHSDGSVTSDGDLKNEPPSFMFYNDLPEAEQKEWVAKLQFSSYAALNATATYVPYTGDFKCTYVMGKRDNSVPEYLAKMYIEQPDAQFIVREGDWGHVPMLSRPEDIVRLIQEAVGDPDFYRAQEIDEMKS